LFIRENRRAGARIPSMPGIRRLTVDEVPAETKELLGLDVSAVLLFGVPAEKDPLGQGAYDEDGVVQTAIRNIKEVNPDIVLMSDVCLCGYTDHGHCGVIRGGGVDNDATVELLAKTAVSHARGGVDIVAPRAMMDGEVVGVRAAVDREGFREPALLACAAKHDSGVDGAFRVGGHSA